jgi:hypothetical protein
MAQRRFGVGEPDTYIVCSRDFQVNGVLEARKGQVVTQVMFEVLRQDFSMDEILAGVKVENTTLLRKVR